MLTLWNTFPDLSNLLDLRSCTARYLKSALLDAEKFELDSSSSSSLKPSDDSRFLFTDAEDFRQASPWLLSVLGCFSSLTVLAGVKFLSSINACCDLK